jgi:hypothetical protein
MDADSFYGSAQIDIGSHNEIVIQGKNHSSIHLGHYVEL